jgi:cell division septation protein DedD
MRTSLPLAPPPLQVIQTGVNPAPAALPPSAPALPPPPPGMTVTVMDGVAEKEAAAAAVAAAVAAKDPQHLKVTSNQ